MVHLPFIKYFKLVTYTVSKESILYFPLNVLVLNIDEYSKYSERVLCDLQLNLMCSETMLMVRWWLLDPVSSGFR